jgi:hypothetical protein
MTLLSLGLAFCLGCGDSSSQSWESKAQTSGKKKSPKPEATPDNDTPDADEPGDTKPTNPHGANPHGASPHAGMQTPTASADEPSENNGKLDIEVVHLTVPKSWVRKAANPMLKAEYAVPKAEGDKMDGRLTVSQAGGSLESNLDRWKGQFSKLDKEHQDTVDIGGIKITLVDFSGTYEDSRGPMMGAGSAVSRPDYRLIGGIFEADGKLNFIKCYGPAKTIAARADEIKGFIKSLKVDK